ncbi:MAG: hypothetical protein JXB26_17610 [Candidatus Aminicenantes bacterium]|nr:hypothetical protein [Candidatus Aminicenantes bacterium]
MPQLVKGGKHTFGWSLVGDGGRIAIPPEALKEYRLTESEKLILVPGSKTSGGFGLGTLKSFEHSPLSGILGKNPDSRKFRTPEGEIYENDGKPFSWVKLRGGTVIVPPETLKKFGIKTGDKLLVIRGSGLAVGFAVKGPIVEEAQRRPELEVFKPIT